MSGSNLPFVDFSDEVPLDYSVNAKSTTIVLDGVNFIFDLTPGLRTDLESFEPKSIEDLEIAAHWLGELNKLWPREARREGCNIQSDLKSLWICKLQAWENSLAQKAEQLLS